MAGFMPKSKTSDDISQSDQGTLGPPEVLPRFHSAENLSAAPGPVAPPRQDSDENKPRPAPRRNVQSCYIEPGSTQEPQVVPPVAPRPQSMIDRGDLPPVPKARPETSQNYYSSIADQTEIKNSDAAHVLLNGCGGSEDSAEYGTAWGGPAPTGPVPVSPASAVPRGPPPAVPKRKDIPDASLMDKPISPGHAVTRDPFDTRAVNPLIPVGVSGPPSGQAPPSVSAPGLPVVPPRPSVQPHPSEQIFINKDDGLVLQTEPELGRPPSPPTFECPGVPPPPPPRKDSDFAHSQGLPDFPAGLGVGAGSAVGLPPVPARPSGVANQEQASFVTPPIPARPNAPPPVPKRPAT